MVSGGEIRDVVACERFSLSIAYVRYSKNIIFLKKVVLIVDLVGESGIISHDKCMKW